MKSIAKLSIAFLSILAASSGIVFSQAPADNTPYPGDYGREVIPAAPVEYGKMSRYLKMPDGEKNTLDLISVKASAKLDPSGKLVLYANPGKNFKVELTVKYKTAGPLKLAANLLLDKAGILDQEAASELKANHNRTWHFDSETRPGYESPSGKGEVTFDLIGTAPLKPGPHEFTMNLGLFDRSTWQTLVLCEFPVILVTDSAMYHATKPVTHPAPAPLLPWTSADGKTIQAAYIKLDGEAVVIRKDGREFTIPFSRLSPESIEKAKALSQDISP